MSILYAAYGSNLHLEQMRYRCPGARPVEAGVIRSHRLLFRRTADIEPQEGGSVPVGLFRLTRSDELNLDRYAGHPRVYRKTEVAVQTESGLINAMAYVMNRLGEAPPQERYAQCIAAGYEDWGLDMAPLVEALTRCGMELDGLNIRIWPIGHRRSEVQESQQ